MRSGLESLVKGGVNWSVCVLGRIATDVYYVVRCGFYLARLVVLVCLILAPFSYQPRPRPCLHHERLSYHRLA